MNFDENVKNDKCVTFSVRTTKCKFAGIEKEHVWVTKIDKNEFRTKIIEVDNIDILKNLLYGIIFLLNTLEEPSIVSLNIQNKNIYKIVSNYCENGVKSTFKNSENTFIKYIDLIEKIYELLSKHKVIVWNN